MLVSFLNLEVIKFSAEKKGTDLTQTNKRKDQNKTRVSFLCNFLLFLQLYILYQLLPIKEICLILIILNAKNLNFF